MSAVDQDGEFHLGGSAVVGKSVESGADRATGKKNVIDEDDVRSVYWKRDIAFLEFRVRVEVLEIVAVEGDIEDSELKFAIVG